MWVYPFVCVTSCLLVIDVGLSLCLCDLAFAGLSGLVTVLARNFLCQCVLVFCLSDCTGCSFYGLSPRLVSSFSVSVCLSFLVYVTVLFAHFMTLCHD